METVANYIVNKEGILVASKDLIPGDVILCLPPIAAGPGRGVAPVCLGCNLKGEEEVLSACSRCSWPVHRSCEEAAYHSQECRLFSSKKYKCHIAASELAAKTNQLDFVHVLRLLLKAQGDTKVKQQLGRLSEKLVTMVKERNRRKYGGDADDAIIQIITKDLGLAINEVDVRQAIAWIERYNIPLDYGARGVYDDIHFMPHNCSPNTYYIGLNSGGVIYRAAQNIRAGEAISTCKVLLDRGNYFRRKLLEDECIDCSCTRCSDPTEFDTGFNCLNCEACRKGLLAPSNNTADMWACRNCGDKKPGKECTEVLDSLQKILDEAAADPKIGTATFYEKIVWQEGAWRQVPATSQLLMDVRKALIFIYQYHKDFYFSQSDWLQLKIEHTEEWLKLAEILFPGFSYIKTLIEYERICANCAMIQAMKQEGEPVSQVNEMCYKVVDLCRRPLEMMIQEEDQSLYKAINQCKMIATEAREEQRTRVYLNMFGGDDEEEEE